MRRPTYYKLADDGRTPVAFESADEWAEYINWRVTNKIDPHIADGQTIIGEAEVSTVFLFMDHSFGDGPPLLWETMVFGGELDGEEGRYATYDEAAAGHAAMCDRVRTSQQQETES